MDVHNLFLSCRAGDLTLVKHLVEQRDVEINARDKWDSTPLYYACLCGHGQVVKYLLEHGAKCEMNTFDGERCLYGALDNEIRNLLKDYKAVTSSTMRRDQYSEFLRRLLERGFHSDITFIVHGEIFNAHRCILASRSKYFAELLNSRWSRKDVVTLSHKLLTPPAFQALLSYLYTARLESPIDTVEDILRLARHCQLDKLRHDLEQKMKEVLSFESSKPGVNVTVLSLEPQLADSTLNEDFSFLVLQALPAGFQSVPGTDQLPFVPDRMDHFADIIFEVEGHKFLCHKAFFLTRSDYFKALVDDHFGESETDDTTSLPIIHIQDMAASVFMQILSFVYQDSCELTPENIFDILYTADLCLLPGLKSQCSHALGRFITTTNVVQMLRTARLFSLVRLEDQCAEFIAGNLEPVLRDPDFTKFVHEDAKNVSCREETDSIGIIDDIRFHISNLVQTFSDMYEADLKMTVIDAFLMEQNLDA